MKFVDELEISVQGGHGGPGSVHFLREKFRPFGGPDGGDGGKGGDVYITSHSSIPALGHLYGRSHFHAPAGEPGRGKNCHGSDGSDIEIRVPVGTEIIDLDTEEVVGDLDRAGMKILAARGGKGGLGNSNFANSVNQAPVYAQPGLQGDSRRLQLKLKLLADCGFVGLPNAGKSTLLAALSRSHPKIADYAFTTLTPNLGVAEGEDLRRVLLADIPGIIEGASRGAGLGLSFLRHIERVKLIVFVLDIGSLDPVAQLGMLKNELESYSKELLKRPAIVVMNKMDEINYDYEFAETAAAPLRKKDLWKKSGVPPIVFVSALEKKGTGDLLKIIFSFFKEPTFAEAMLTEEDQQASPV